MRSFRKSPAPLVIALVACPAAILAGCARPPGAARPERTPSHAAAAEPAPDAGGQVGPAASATGGETAPAFGRVLRPDAVVAAVLARNPTVAEMAAAVQKARARYPQVTSLDDPMLASWVAPGSLGSDKVNDSVRFELSQKFPFPGKRTLRGEAAEAEASAAGFDLEGTRLELVESARAAYADYYLAVRALEVNADGRRLLREFRQNAEARYKTGQTPQQDILQAEVELGRQGEQRLVLERARAVAVARLNTLMSLPPEAPLPPPAEAARRRAALPGVRELRELALARRPDLHALAARVAADAATLAAAEREYYPDVEVMTAYDSFWQSADDQERLRPQVGVRVNLPIQLGRRQGAAAEAAAQLFQRRAALARQQNQVALEVQEAYAEVRESEQAVRLYAGQILPAARESVKSAQAGYVTGGIPFLTLIEAQRSLVELRDRSYLASADYERRLAALERAVGGPLEAAPGR
ncbi:MAG: TolC family protein [Isosphaera sp.]|nr:TolC family protein [Isosphaera sp.]